MYPFRLLILILPCVFLSTTVKSQANLDSVSIQITGTITIDTVYNQYFLEEEVSDTLLSPWEFYYCDSYYPDIPFFVFKNVEVGRDYKYYERTLIDIDPTKPFTKRPIHKDSIDCSIKEPLLETSVNKIYQHIKTWHWNLITEIVDDGCQDTHYSNLEVSNLNGTIKFEHLNNISIYNFGWSSDTRSLLIVSTRRCLNELIIFKIK